MVKPVIPKVNLTATDDHETESKEASEPTPLQPPNEQNWKPKALKFTLWTPVPPVKTKDAEDTSNADKQCKESKGDLAAKVKYELNQKCPQPSLTKEDDDRWRKNKDGHSLF